VRRFLPSPPFDVGTAVNGRVALASMQVNWPDIVFMDLDMPVMGGMQAAQAMRALERARGKGGPCHIIALSSHDDAETRAEALAAGFDRYLTKPVTRGAIEEMLMLFVAHEEPVAPIRTAAPGTAHAPGRDDPVIVDPDVQAMLASFIESRRSLVGAMESAMSTGDREEVRRIAHQLSGSFSLYGFAWASAQARWIETNAAHADAIRLHAIARELQAHLDTVRLRTAHGAIIETAGQPARGDEA